MGMRVENLVSSREAHGSGWRYVAEAQLKGPLYGMAGGVYVWAVSDGGEIEFTVSRTSVFVKSKVVEETLEKYTGIAATSGSRYHRVFCCLDQMLSTMENWV